MGGMSDELEKLKKHLLNNSVHVAGFEGLTAKFGLIRSAEIWQLLVIH